MSIVFGRDEGENQVDVSLKRRKIQLLKPMGASSLILEKINCDKGPDYPETRAVLGDKTPEWQKNNGSYVAYMEKGQDIECVNAAMYEKLRYTPWVDFPPQNSHPLEDWLSIYNGLEDCLSE